MLTSEVPPAAIPPTLHVKCHTWKCLSTDRTSSTAAPQEVVNVLPTTPELHVRAGSQRLSQVTITNDMYKEVVAAAVIYSNVTQRYCCIRVRRLISRLRASHKPFTRLSSNISSVLSCCTHADLLKHKSGLQETLVRRVALLSCPAARLNDSCCQLGYHDYHSSHGDCQSSRNDLISSNRRAVCEDAIDQIGSIVVRRKNQVYINR